MLGNTKRKSAPTIHDGDENEPKGADGLMIVIPHGFVWVKPHKRNLSAIEVKKRLTLPRGRTFKLLYGNAYDKLLNLCRQSLEEGDGEITLVVVAASYPASFLCCISLSGETFALSADVFDDDLNQGVKTTKTVHSPTPFVSVSA